MTINSAPSFSIGDGKVTTAIGTGGDYGQSLALAPDGKIVVAGFMDNGPNRDIALVRYNADGSLDTTFDFDGKVTTDIGSAPGICRSVILLPDGKILAAGASESDFAVIRYNNNGSVDTSFGGGDGIVTTAIGAAEDQGYGVTRQSDGKFLVGGVTWNGANYDFALVRYNADGTLDTSFDGDGKVTTTVGPTDDQARSIALQSDGKILVAGVVSNGTNNDFGLVRYNTDGSLDASFGSSGKVITSIGPSYDGAFSVVVQPDGKIVSAGFGNTGPNNDFAIVRHTADGSLDATFGIGGKVTVPLLYEEWAQSVTLQPDGKIVVVGGTNSDIGLVRLNSDGSLDTTFDGDGKVVTAIGSNIDKGWSVAVQPDGKILVAGEAVIGNTDFALVRYNPDGSLDLTFDGTNTLNGAPSYIEDGAAVVLDSSVAIYDAELVASGSYDGATLTLARHGGASAEDTFGASNLLTIIPEGNNLIVSGTTIGAVTQNSGGTLVLTFNASATQSLVDVAMGFITYANTSDAPPASVQIDWVFSDGNSGAQGTGGAQSATGSTTVSITAVNDAPILFGPGTLVAIAEDSGARLITQADLLANVSDPDGPLLAAINLAITSGNGTLDDNGDGTWTYTPAADDDSTVTFSYEVTDGIAAPLTLTATLDLTPVNDAPAVFSGPGGTFSEDTINTTVVGGTNPGDTPIAVLATDVDSTLTAASFTPVSVTIDGVAATLADAGISYNPATGLASFDATVAAYQHLKEGETATVVYTQAVSDGQATSLGQLTYTVIGVNDAPVGALTGTLANGTEDVPYTVGVADLFAGFTDPDGETLNAANVNASSGAVTDNGDGTYTITQAANFHGDVTLTFDVLDPFGTGFAFETRTYTVNSINDAPTGAPTAVLASGTEDVAYTVLTSDLLAGFADADGDTLFVTSLAATDGTVSNNGDGSFTITPTANFHGDVTLTYDVADRSSVGGTGGGGGGSGGVGGNSGGGGGGSGGGSGGSGGGGGSAGPGGVLTGQTRTYTLNPVNDAPTGSPTTVLSSGTEDEAYTVSATDLLAGFSDIDGDTLSVASLSASSGSVIGHGDGTFTISAPANANGLVTLTYDVTDGNGGTVAAQTRTFTRAAMNDAPSAVALSRGVVAENNVAGALVGVLGASDVDDDSAFTFALASGPGGTDNSAFTISGDELHFSGVADFETKMTYSIRLSVTDAGGASHEEIKTISVTNISPEIQYGTAAANILTGGSDVDRLFGFGGNDHLLGAGGRDLLVGGTGRDKLSGGHDAVRDVFDFNAIRETGKTAATRDVITDFRHHIDDIDVSTIDASTKKAGNQKFEFIGTAGFHKAAGELHVVTSGANRVVEGDVNGDGKADFQIQVSGHATLTAADFIL